MFKAAMNGWDLLGTLGGVYVLGNMAAASPTMRYTLGGRDSAVMDLRFLGGMAGLAANKWGTGSTARIGADAAIAGFSSWVTTEQVRRHAEARMHGQEAPMFGLASNFWGWGNQQAAAHTPAPPPAQIPTAPPGAAWGPPVAPAVSGYGFGVV